MKVYVCKFFRDKNISSTIRKLILKSMKHSVDNIRVFCVDEQVHEGLIKSDIDNEIFVDFQNFSGFYDETSWEQGYAISDQINTSAFEFTWRTIFACLVMQSPSI